MAKAESAFDRDTWEQAQKEAMENDADWLRDRADRVDAEDTDNTTDRTYKIPD